MTDTDDVAVVVETKTTIKSEVHGNIDFEIDDDGSFNVRQDNDHIYMTRASSIALAKVILQHHGVSFEHVHQQEVDYTA